MRTKLLMIAGFFVVAATILCAWFLLKNKPASEPNDPGVEFPTDIGEYIPGQGQTGAPERIVTKGFIDNGITIEDPANEGDYYLAGTTGYCYDDGTCASAGIDAGYNIVYHSEDDSFVIGLKEEPLGDVRRAAERFLMETLGLDEQSMCTLRTYVGTTLYVSEVYGSKGNLGFSFCPGAIPLP